MWSDLSPGEEKPENAVAHVGDEAGDVAAFADDSGDGEVFPVRGVVFVLLGCFGEDTDAFVRRGERDLDAVFWNAGKVNPDERVSVLQRLELHEPFRPTHQKLVVGCVKPVCSHESTTHRHKHKLQEKSATHLKRNSIGENVKRENVE